MSRHPSLYAARGAALLTESVVRVDGGRLKTLVRRGPPRGVSGRTRAGALLVAAVVLAGCAGGTGGSGGTDPAPTSPAQPAGSVTYDVRAGSFPDGVASATVRLQVVLVEDTDDLGPCYPGVFRGPYEPTVTPIPPPSGECHRTETVTLALTPGAERTVGPFDAPPGTAGYALVLANATVRAENGSTVAGVRGTTTSDLAETAARPDGERQRVELRIEAYDDRSYDYWLFGRASEG